MTKYSRLFFVLSTAVLILIFTTIALLRENHLGTFKFQNIDNIDVTIKATVFEKINIRNEDYAFLYFEYVVTNRNQKAVQFDPSAIRIKCNGAVNSETHYHSIASAIAEPIPLPAGKSTYFLYGIYPSDIKHSAIDSLSLEDAGFSISAFGEEGVDK